MGAAPAPPRPCPPLASAGLPLTLTNPGDGCTELSTVVAAPPMAVPPACLGSVLGLGLDLGLGLGSGLGLGPGLGLGLGLVLGLGLEFGLGLGAARLPRLVRRALPGVALVSRARYVDVAVRRRGGRPLKVDCHSWAMLGRRIATV